MFVATAGDQVHHSRTKIVEDLKSNRPALLAGQVGNRQENPSWRSTEKKVAIEVMIYVQSRPKGPFSRLTLRRLTKRLSSSHLLAS
jgi:hypothetical protein